MQKDMSKIRNIGISAHIDAGKTTTTERILFFSNVIHKMGEVHDGASVMDFMAQERERGITIQSATTKIFWNDFEINIIDTPGHVDFTAEVEKSFRILDGAVIVLCGVGGIQPQTETVWRQADKYSVPRIIYINKMDRMGADFYRAVNDIESKLSYKAIAIQHPIGEAETFQGVIDLIFMKAFFYKEDGTQIEKDIPECEIDVAKSKRLEMLESLSNYNDELMELYLSEKEISSEMILKVLRDVVLNRDIFVVPVVCGSSFKNKCVQPLLNKICELLPSPLDVPPVSGLNPSNNEKIIRKPFIEENFSGIVFKIVSDAYTKNLSYLRVYSGVLNKGDVVFNSSSEQKERISRLYQMHSNSRKEINSACAGDVCAVVGLKDVTTGDTLCDLKNQIIFEKIKFPPPVISMSIEPQKDDDQFGIAIQKIVKEDPTLFLKINHETGQTIISGMGELHLEILKERLREMGVEVSCGAPEVSYRETITNPSKSEGLYKKQTGGRGQYGHVLISVEPLEDSSGFEFQNKIVGGAIPKEFIPSVLTGIKETLSNGIIAGYPVQGIRVILYDGSYHEVDSSEMAFKIAGSMAIKQAVKDAMPVLLEPIMKVETTVPSVYTGAIVGDNSSRRGSIKETENRNDITIVRSLIPLVKLFGYATDIRSATKGRCDYFMEFHDYQLVPKNIMADIVGKFNSFRSK